MNENEFEVEDFEFQAEEKGPQEDVVSMDDPKWSEYVLSLLADDEQYDGSPTTDGLRRLAMKLFGAFSYDGPAIHAINEGYAALTVKLIWPDRVVTGSAECNSANSDGVWGVYPLATAETRAEGRALKKALGLKRIFTAEETSHKAKLSVPVNDDLRSLGSITDTQITFIDKMCKKYDISVKELVENVVSNFKSIKDVSYSEALEINKLLDEWSKNKPENVSKYNSNWRNEE